MAKKYKRIIAVAVILLAVALVELIANRHALRENYGSLKLDDRIQVVEDGGKEKYEMIFKEKAGVYVRQIELSGSFPEEAVYRIRTREVNAFGRTEAGKYKDTVTPHFTEFSTNLDRKVRYLKITIPKTEGMELTGISVSNQAEINKYRMLAVALFLLFLYCAFFEKTFVRKIEWYFVGFALGFGILIISLGQTSCNSWDEQIHFAQTYRIASGRDVVWTKASRIIADRENFKCNTKDEFAQLRAYMDEKGEEIEEIERKTSLMIPFQKIAYLPMALFLAVGKLLRLPFSALFAFGKLGNLLVYVLVMFYAIRLAPNKKLFLAFIAMMPTALLQAVSYTYDSVVFSFLTLGCVLWCRETYFGRLKPDMRMAALAVGMMVFGSLSKAIYIPMVLMMLLLPWLRNRSRKEKLLFAAGIGVVFLVLMMTFVLPVISNMAAGNMAYGGDSRGGDTSVARQLISMVKHPWASIRLMAENIFALDNFRNLGNPESARYFVGNLMLLSFSAMGTLGDKWCILLLPMLTILLFHEEEGNARIAGRRTWDKVLTWSVFALIVVLIWSAMYLSFTPVGAAEIAGVQARYYLPLLYLGALLVTNTKIRIQVKEQTLAKLTMALPCVLMMAAVAELGFRNRMI